MKLLLNKIFIKTPLGVLYFSFGLLGFILKKLRIYNNLEFFYSPYIKFDEENPELFFNTFVFTIVIFGSFWSLFIIYIFLLLNEQIQKLFTYYL